MIPYHGTPLGGKNYEKSGFLTTRHALVSFHHPRDLEVVAQCCRSWCIDNGAFSSWRSGEPVQDWKPYYEFCKAWMRHPRLDFCIIPDVIDGSVMDNDLQIANWMNWVGWKTKQDELSRWHLNEKSCPVWHMHEPLERLVRLAKGWARIAIGSSGEFAKIAEDGPWADRMTEAFEAITIDGQPICKVHGLRMMNAKVFSLFPFSSVDSTNVAQNTIRKAKQLKVRESVARMLIAERVEPHNSPSTFAPRPKSQPVKNEQLSFERIW